MSNKNNLSQIKDPLLIISKEEGNLGNKILTKTKYDPKTNQKTMLPIFLNPISKVKIQNQDSDGENMMGWVFQKLEDDEIPYTTSEMGIASYIVKNKNTGKNVVIKRFTMEDILHIFTMKSNVPTIYQGLRGFELMIRDLSSTYNNDVKIEIVIEDYDLSIFDYSEGCIWVPWKINYSDKKIDAVGSSIYMLSNMKKFKIHPNTFNDAIQNLVRKYKIIVKKFTDTRSLYSHIVDELIYGREYNEEEDRSRSSPSLKEDYLMSAIPFISAEDARGLLSKFKSNSKVIDAMLIINDISKLGLPELYLNQFKQWKKLMLEEE